MPPVNVKVNPDLWKKITDAMVELDKSGQATLDGIWTLVWVAAQTAMNMRAAGAGVTIEGFQKLARDVFVQVEEEYAGVNVAPPAPGGTKTPS